MKEDIGKIIKEKRLLLNLTQQELAERADISRSYLVEIEKGVYNISSETLIKLASVLDVDLNFFKTS
jgi:transcriptional regulator with XRE-family HTH domain|nr:MAG TPA: helix-turn-helix domain protein [Caudoviricetes sp.]